MLLEPTDARNNNTILNLSLPLFLFLSNTHEHNNLVQSKILSVALRFQQCSVFIHGKNVNTLSYS